MLINHAGLAADRQARLEGDLEPLAILDEVVRWGFALQEGGDIVDVVVQDEYTHDVVMTWESRFHLVFDTT